MVYTISKWKTNEKQGAGFNIQWIIVLWSHTDTRLLADVEESNTRASGYKPHSSTSKKDVKGKGKAKMVESEAEEAEDDIEDEDDMDFIADDNEEDFDMLSGDPMEEE